MGIAKDNFDTGGRNVSYAIGFAEVEVDTETGAVRLKDYKVVVGCRDDRQSADLRRAAPRRRGAGLRGRARAEVGLRPTVGAPRLQALLLEPSAVHARRAPRAADGLGGGERARSRSTRSGRVGIGEAAQGAGTAAPSSVRHRQCPRRQPTSTARRSCRDMILTRRSKGCRRPSTSWRRMRETGDSRRRI